jgi:hypothetical protein
MPGQLRYAVTCPHFATRRSRDPEASHGGLPVVLTDLLTTALDDRGRDRTEKPGEQGRSDPVDGTGRL